MIVDPIAFSPLNGVLNGNNGEYMVEQNLC